MKNKMDRLGRFKNRTEPGKKVTDSWDWDLSIGDVKWSIGWFWSQYMYVRGLGFRSRDDKGVLKTHWILTIFVLQWARKLKIRLKKIISTKILIKYFFWWFFGFSFSWFHFDPHFCFLPNFRFRQFWCKKCWTTLNIWYY